MKNKKKAEPKTEKSIQATVETKCARSGKPAEADDTPYTLTDDADGTGDIPFKVTAPNEAAPDPDNEAAREDFEAAENAHKTSGRHEEATDDAQETLNALRDLTAEGEEEGAYKEKVTLTSILGGDMLGGKWFRKYFWYMVMVAAMLIVYVSNRYYCQQEMLETKTLSDTLLDRRYKALTRSSQLKEKTRRSCIEESLTDTTLQTANTPSFNLKVE